VSGSTGVAADAGLDELVCLLAEAELSEVDLVLQSRPAHEPVLARQRELRRSERDLVGHRADTPDRGGISGPGGAEEVFRLAAEVVEIGVGGE